MSLLRLTQIKSLKNTLLLLFLSFISLNLVYAQEKTAANETPYLRINSIPQDARVYFNDTLIGNTPLDIYRISLKANTLRLIKEGYNDWTTNIFSYKNVVEDITAILDGDYGIVDILSEPSDAQVFIDDSLIGITPLKEIQLSCSRHKFRISKDGYESFSSVYLIPPRQFSIFPILKSVTSTVSFNEVKPSVQIIVDGMQLDKNSLENLTITAGQHEIEYKGAPLKRSFSQKVYFDSEYSYRVELASHSYYPFYYSMLLPGSGQIYNGSVIKGAAIMTGTLVTGVLALSSISNYNSKVEAAHNAQTLYRNSSNESLASYYHDIVMSSRSDANKALNLKRVAIGAFLGMYFYNLIDALLFESSNEIKVYSRKINVNTDISLNGGNYSLELYLPF
jgi:hypothetical protein